MRRIDLIEKLVLVKAGLAVVGVAGLITYGSLGTVCRGGAPVFERSAFETQQWLEGQRRTAESDQGAERVLSSDRTIAAPRPNPNPK